VLTTGLGYLCAIPLPRWLGIDPRWGVAGLTASAGVAGWVEFTLLRRSLNRRIGSTGLPVSLTVRLWGSAAAAATIGWAVKVTLGLKDPIFDAAAILAAYGVVYFLLTWVGEVDECRRLLTRFLPGAGAGSAPPR
jgi:putative peptidoglycan lipid II flippase